MSRCRDVSAQLLPEYIKGDLPGPEALLVQRHLELCGTCNLEARVLLGLAKEVVPEPPPWFRRELAGRVTAEAGSKGFGRENRWLIPAFGSGMIAAAVVLLLLLRGGSYDRQVAAVTGFEGTPDILTPSLGIEEEILSLSGGSGPYLERGLVPELGAETADLLSTVDLLPSIDLYENMDDETMRSFEELIDRMTPEGAGRKVMS